MALILGKLNEHWVLVIALLAALLLAAHQSLVSASFGVVGNYLYWFCRVLIEAGFFLAVLFSIDKYAQDVLPDWGRYVAAIAISLVPFALAITAFDLIIGLPELGLNDSAQTQQSRIGAFGLELIYLLDNHIALCALLLLPRLMLAPQDQSTASQSEHGSANSTANPDESLSFIAALDPPLDGSIHSIEAQEHYVRVVTGAESRLVLYRFSDAVRQISPTLGMQVHRSHWVAHVVVKRIVVNGQTMKLELHSGRFVPVSRTFRASVEKQYATKISSPG